MKREWTKSEKKSFAKSQQNEKKTLAEKSEEIRVSTFLKNNPGAPGFRAF